MSVKDYSQSESSGDYSRYSLRQLQAAASSALAEAYGSAQDVQYSRGARGFHSNAQRRYNDITKEIQKREKVANEQARQREAAEKIRLANRSSKEKLQDAVDLGISAVARTAQSARGAALIMAKKARVSIPMNMQYAKETAIKHKWLSLAVTVSIVVTVCCAVVLYGLSIQQSSPCGDSGMLSLAFVVIVFIGLLFMLGYSLHRGHEVSSDVRRDALAASRSRHRKFIRAQTDFSARENLANRLVQGFSAKNNTPSAQPLQFEMQEMQEM